MKFLFNLELYESHKLSAHLHPNDDVRGTLDELTDNTVLEFDNKDWGTLDHPKT